MTVADPTCESIDAKRLYTDVVYRFQYLAKFAEFGEDDIKAIHESAPLVEPLVPAIVDAVYVKLFSFDLTKAVFTQRNSSFKGQVAHNLKDLHLDNDQIKFRKDFLGKYLKKLVTGKYDDNFVRYLDYVGKIHTDYSGKASKIQVEYIHCSALFTYVSSFIVQALMNANLPKDVEQRTVLAFNKLLWIQNDFFSKYYVKDPERHGLGLTFVQKNDQVLKMAGVTAVIAAIAVGALKFLKD
ncbi:hypothetical protein MP228_011881 [Amoeboaphelidium protococcarum]|nr:hypothetical protein MP228_011881 [Amoeboaphelidium protococcarum]